MKTSLLLLLMTLLPATALAMSSQPAADYDSDNAEADAAAALADGDHRLLGIPLRLVSLPGVPSAQHEAASAACGVRLIEGDDALEDAAEAAALKQRTAYVRRYNRWMLQRCL